MFAVVNKIVVSSWKVLHPPHLEACAAVNIALLSGKKVSIRVDESALPGLAADLIFLPAYVRLPVLAIRRSQVLSIPFILANRARGIVVGR